MKNIRYVQRALLAFSLSFVGVLTPLSARDAGSLGRSGGSEFRSTCQPNHVLIGLNIKKGSALDSVVAICIGTNAEKTAWDGGAYEASNVWGGSGGLYEKVACKKNYAVKSMYVFTDKFDVVHHFVISCRDLGSDHAYRTGVKSLGGASVNQSLFSCQEDEFSTGIYGRAGDLVDQLGIQCTKFNSVSNSNGDAAFKKQREDELQVTGKSPRECETSNQSCEARFKAQIPYPASIGVIAKECQPYFQQCMTNAARRLGNEAEAKKVRDNETQVTGRSPEQCQAAFYSCRIRLMAQLGKLKGLQESGPQCEPYRNQCLNNAAAAQPSNGGGDGGQSLVTVLQSVDVYETPGGEGQKIGNLRKGAKVSVVGDCADSWCHITGRRVPNGDGYVYNGDDYKSLNF